MVRRCIPPPRGRSGRVDNDSGLRRGYRVGSGPPAVRSYRSASSIGPEGTCASNACRCVYVIVFKAVGGQKKQGPRRNEAAGPSGPKGGRVYLTKSWPAATPWPERATITHLAGAAIGAEYL